MQDRYAGDVGDFGKFGLLRALSATGLSVGVNWYYTLPPASERNASGSFKHNDGMHGVPPALAGCDQALADALGAIASSPTRSVLALMEKDLVPGARYFAELVPRATRELWHHRATDQLSGCDVVFLDPDNGLLAPSVREGSPASVKYVLDREVTAYLERGQSVVLYHHRPRRQAREHLTELVGRLVTAGADPSLVSALTFPKGTVRDYLILPASSEHVSPLERARSSLLQGSWGQAGLCRDDLSSLRETR